MPQMLHDVVHAILAEESDLDIGEASLCCEVTAREVLHQADVLIVADSAMTSSDCDSVLYAHPCIRVVAITANARGATVYELRPTRVELGQLSSQVLIAAIRAPSATQTVC